MNNKFRWTSKTDYSGNTLQRDDLQKKLDEAYEAVVEYAKEVERLKEIEAKYEGLCK